MLGPETKITIPTLNPRNLRRYVKEDAHLHIVHMPTIFFFALRCLVKENNLVLLVEGSTYMDTWTSAMLWAYLWTTWWADRLNRDCLAYAVDAGQLRPRNQRLVRRVASKTDLIITCSRAATDRLRSWGVTAPIEATADNAFNYQIDSKDEGWFHQAWPEPGRRIVGMALVDFYLFPVVMRLWGPKEECYKWPYYFARSPERDRLSDELATIYAQLADCLVEYYDASIALIGMEQLDERLLNNVQQRMERAGRARVFSSAKYNASQLAALLRSLDLLITSRYHACVLSMAADVPQIAIGHDLRLKSIYEELGLKDEYFVTPEHNTIYRALLERVRRLMTDPGPVREVLRRGYAEHLASARRNRELLRGFLQARGYRVQS